MTDGPRVVARVLLDQATDVEREREEEARHPVAHRVVVVVGGLICHINKLYFDLQYLCSQVGRY